ncbi:MAG TPA: hypothetical protein VIM41_06615 [Gammaproteobacteria bacterium]
MTEIKDFSAQELDMVQQTLKERYGHNVELELADVELRLDPIAYELTTCPALYWEMSGCHFVISKLGKMRYYAQFYYRGYEQFGTGIREFDDLFDCVTTLLRVQADHDLMKGQD